jgi:SAM-dependent methyltransferase
MSGAPAQGQAVGFIEAVSASQVPAIVHLPPPYNLLRLSFDTYEEVRAYWHANANMWKQIWLWHESLGNREEPFQLPGVCDICECQTTFIATPQKMPEGDQFAFRVPWWQGVGCGCKMSTLDRTVIRVFLDGGSKEERLYHVGYHSAFRRWLSERMPNVTASQYEEGRRPGEIENDIRYEDLTSLSFADNEFDCIICMEVLEHIPDYQAGLREMARTLKPGGRALLSFPWLGGEHYDHFIRAELLPDGSINHIHPPEYHGDPAKAQGILSFRAFGWKILGELRDAGFARASAKFVFGPLHGYMQLLTPIIVGVR